MNGLFETDINHFSTSGAKQVVMRNKIGVVSDDSIGVGETNEQTGINQFYQILVNGGGSAPVTLLRQLHQNFIGTQMVLMLDEQRQYLPACICRPKPTTFKQLNHLVILCVHHLYYTKTNMKL